MKILVLNSGSSSIKYELFDARDWATLTSGNLEEPGDHRAGIDQIMTAISKSGAIRDSSELEGIGHRVVHGGEAFSEATLVDARVIAAIRATIPLAPLHNPANLQGIEAARALYPHVPQVAVFDTAFHRTLPPHVSHYAIPMELAKHHGIRRYGFQGTSHAYVARRAAQLLGRPLDSLDLVTLHLGNGASACAIHRGHSVETSMGMTPLEGLVMGTRCGDIDPAIPSLIGRVAAKSVGEVDALLEGASGLQGLCGDSDMRRVLARADAGDAGACLARDVYCHRVKKYIGAYFAVLGRLDALVFTAGVGENNAAIRAQCCEGLAGLGVRIDLQKNLAASKEARAVHAERSVVAILVVPTHEELEIAYQTRACIEAARTTEGKP
jgi:acetate kinase